MMKHMIHFLLSLLYFCATVSFAQQIVPPSDGKKQFFSEADILTGEMEEEDAVLYNWKKCLRCHDFTEQDLIQQQKRARKRHRQAQSEKTPCFKCHDNDEVTEICCHIAFTK